MLRRLRSLAPGDYGKRQAKLLTSALGPDELDRRLAAGEQLPEGYGVGFDERVVEFPWLYSQRPFGRLLDAGSTLNLAESNRIEEFMELLGGAEGTARCRACPHSCRDATACRSLPGSDPAVDCLRGPRDRRGGARLRDTGGRTRPVHSAGPRGRELRAGDALFDHLVTAVYPDMWFDFGISNERSGELNEGLMRNKEGFGARAVVHDRYVLDLG